MRILMRQNVLLDSTVLAAVIFQCVLCVAANAQSITYQAKAGSHANSLSEIVVPDQVDHLIITPKDIKGGKLIEQLEHHNDRDRKSTRLNSSHT